MTLALDIRGSGTAWFILHRGQRVGGPYTGHGNAVAALRGVERRLAPQTAKFRSCCTCKQGFLSTGETHCPDCRMGAAHG
ncbi:hypothetical protein MASR1M32_10170 [Rhodobacter sp.]